MPREEKSIIKPLISNTQITPQYKSFNKIFELNLAATKLPPSHIIKLLYVSDRYVELIEYVDAICSNKEKINLNDNQIIIYSDAFYRLGKYNEAINSLNTISENYPIDEKYFLLALYNKKLGRKTF